MKSSVLKYTMLLALQGDLAFSQSISALNIPNEIGFELGGQNFYYAPYYQRNFKISDKTQLGLRLSVDVFPYRYDGILGNAIRPGIGMGILPNFLFYKKKHAWELGLGITDVLLFSGKYPYRNIYGETIYRTDNVHIIFLSPQFGYRKYFKDGKFYLKTSVLLHIGLTAIFENPYQIEGNRVLPWASFGLGYTFGKRK